MKNPSIAIIGAGFSGTMLAVHLVSRCPPGTRIRLIERRPAFGPGLPYATDRDEHLLNVPAERMSAFANRPAHFRDWLHRQPDTVLRGIAPQTDFVPRRLFGLYLQDILDSAPAGTLDRVQDEVLSLSETEDSVTLHFADRAPMLASVAVLATGNNDTVPPPNLDPAHAAGSAYRNDPWAANVFDGLPPDGAVLLIGTGLTMVDAFLHLAARGHTGPVHALSRRGWAPRTHTAPPTLPPPDPLGFPRGLMPLFRRVRAEADRALAAGGTWQSVIDALRPVTQALWQGWSDAERRRFLTHLRPAWDVHRHRVAPSVGAALDVARAGGRLSIHAGRIRSIVAQGATAAVTWQPRGLAERRVLHVARVVNCTGASSDVTRTTHPLIQSLLRDGFARPDPRRLGLDVSAAGAIRDCTGTTSGRLFGIGPVCRGALWEIVAVPDIRQQCERLASHLAAIVRFGDDPPAQKCTEQSSDTATIVASSYGASSSPSLPGGSA